MRTLVLALLCAGAALAEPPSVAVLPLRALGIPADAAKALEGTLRAEVGRMPEVQLADPAAVQKALRSESDCLASLSCAAGAASRVGASRFTVGTVSSLGESYLLDLKLLDARSGSELRRVSRPISGAKDQLIEAVRAAAVELLAPARYAGALYAEALLGDARAPGAELFIDGKAVGRTPLAEPISGLPPGQHALRLAREGGADVGVFVEVRFERVTSVRVDLMQRSVVWVAYLTPEAARAVIDEALRPPPLEKPTDVGNPPPGPVLVLAPAPEAPPRVPWLRVAGWSSLGLGVVAALVGVAFHARAYSTAADLNRRAQANSLNSSDLQSYTDIDSEVHAARLLYGVGAALGVAGGAALLYDRTLDRAAPQAQSWRAQPLLGPRGAGLGLVKSF